MTQEEMFQELYNKTLQTLSISAVALFHQVLLRESKKEVIDKAIEGTDKMLKEITNDFLNKDTLGPFFNHQHMQPEVLKAKLDEINTEVKEKLREYAYKSYISELVR